MGQITKKENFEIIFSLIIILHETISIVGKDRNNFYVDEKGYLNIITVDIVYAI
ncbi:hypothetical protein [Clostridium butyricum]|uniref:hypothetical protein n=1 Tax=Clostridium butyricum TaxID=1492 RepID=UPI00374EED03